jgi:hypothetical protein
MKYLVISFVLLTWPLWGHCQNPKWFFQMGGVEAGNLSNIEPKFHVSPLDSSIYITGAFYGTDVLRFGDEMISNMTLTSGENGMFLLKLTQHGVLQWAKTFKGGGANFFHDVAFDHNGDIYVGGQTGDPITIEDALIDYGGSSGYILMKYSHQGDFQWLLNGQNGNIQELEWTEAGLTGAMVFENTITVDGNMFTSTPSPYSPAQDILLFVTDMDGQLVFSEQLVGNGNIDARSFTCNDTLCVLQGKFDNDLILDGSTYSTTGNANYKAYQYAYKVNPFQALWTDTSNEPFSVMQNASHIDTDGDLYTVATIENTFQMQDSTAQSTGGRDILLIQQHLNSGEIVKMTTFGSSGTDAAYHITEDAGRFIVSGLYNSSELVFNGVTLQNQEQLLQPFAVVLDTSLKGQCALNIHTDMQSTIFQSQILGDTLLSLIQVTSSIFVEDTTLNAYGSFDLAILKTVMPCSRITGVENYVNADKPTLHIYPNPASQSIRVEATGNSQQQPAITIIDMLGHAVLHHPSAGHEQHIDISGFANGIYTIAAILGNGETRRQRLVVQR